MAQYRIMGGLEPSHYIHQNRMNDPIFLFGLQHHSFITTKHLPLGVNFCAAVSYCTSCLSLGDLATAAEASCGRGDS